MRAEIEARRRSHVNYVSQGKGNDEGNAALRVAITGANGNIGRK